MELQPSLGYYDFVPKIVPQNMNGKLNYRICIIKHHTKADGTNTLYLNIYYNGKRKRLNLNISVPLKFFDAKKQRVKTSYKYAADYNLLIEKILGDLNSIEISYRLSEETITLKKVVEDLLNPSLRVNYNVFALNFLEYQNKNSFIKASTYRQQKGFCSKIKKFKDPLLFSDIDEGLLKSLRVYLKDQLKNKPATIESTIKNFKKYLHEANKRGIKTKLNYQDVKVKAMKGDFTFLLPSELKKLHSFYGSEFINTTWKGVLQRYLFSCFTGLRISDVEKLDLKDHIIDGVLVIYQQKTGKLNKIPLNKVALNLIKGCDKFQGNYSREHINRELKLIAKACNIKKRLYFHSSRHTFATNYLIAGGQVQNLQRLLGHSKIETTMLYVHAVESVNAQEIKLMEDIVG
jgi:integrase